MAYQPQILLQQLSYSTPDSQSLFRDLSLSFGRQKTAIVGRNGIGKTTLLKLIVGELKSTTGRVNRSGAISYCPQNTLIMGHPTLAQALGISEKLAALESALNCYQGALTVISHDERFIENIHVSRIVRLGTV